MSLKQRAREKNFAKTLLGQKPLPKPKPRPKPGPKPTVMHKPALRSKPSGPTVVRKPFSKRQLARRHPRSPGARAYAQKRPMKKKDSGRNGFSDALTGRRPLPRVTPLTTSELNRMYPDTDQYPAGLRARSRKPVYDGNYHTMDGDRERGMSYWRNLNRRRRI